MILVIAEHRDGTLNRATLETINVSLLGHNVYAVKGQEPQARGNAAQ